MKQETIDQIKKRLDYAHEYYFNTTIKAARITQLYTYLMSVHDEVKTEPRFWQSVNDKAREFINDPNASRTCKKTMQKWIDEYSNEEELLVQVCKKRKYN